MLVSVNEFWAASYIAAEWAIRIAALLVVPLRRSPEATRSWLLFFFFLPVPAVFIYLLIGRPRYPKWRQERFARLPDIQSAAQQEIVHSRFCRRPDLPPNMKGIARLIEQLGQFPTVAGNDVELLHEYHSIIEQMVADIDGARETVHLSFYIFADDETGRLVMDALKRAATRGASCRVLVDALGSWQWRKRVVAILGGSGVQVRLALDVGIFRRRSARADLRNHRKICVIDSRIGYLGSQNVINAADSKGIRNEELVARFNGPLTAELQAVFIADWFMETDEKLTAPKLFPHQAPRGRTIAQILPSGPDYPRAGIGILLTALVHGTRDQIIIATPYFVPDEALLQALKTAAYRGVDVRLVLSGVTDHMFVGLAQQSYYSELLDAGVRIYLYRQRFLHAKNISLDREIVIIGSSNIDIRSFLLNAEVSMIAFDKDLADRLYTMQSTYLEESIELRYADWQKRGKATKVLENLARLAGPLL